MPKKIISYILSFILLITLLSSIVIGIFSETVLNQNYMLGILEKTDYYNSIYDIIMDNFENNTIQSGLTEDVLDGIISKEKVYDDINTLITYLYKDIEELEIDAESIKTSLEKNIAKQIAESDKTVTADEQEDIDDYVETIVKIYKNSIVYSESYIPSVQTVLVKTISIVNRFQVIAYATSVILILLLIFINRKRSAKYISISLIATGVFCIIVKIMESYSMKISNVTMFNQAFSNTIATLLTNIMNNFLILGIIALVIGIILNIISGTKRFNY